MSGSARVALGIALANTSIAGVTDIVYQLRALVADVTGLADVSAEAARVDEMSRRSDVRKALKRERDSDDAEWRMVGEASLGKDRGFVPVGDEPEARRRMPEGRSLRQTSEASF